MKKAFGKIRTVGAVIVAAALLAIFIIFACNESLTVKHYSVGTGENDGNTAEKIRIVFLSDLHSTDFGKEQQILADTVEKEEPDIVIFGGDIFEEDADSEVTWETLKIFSEKYPCFYATGNHDYGYSDISGIKMTDILSRIEELGIKVLDGKTFTFGKNGKSVDVCGTDDIFCKPVREIDGLYYFDELTECENSAKKSENFVIFVTHRPSYIDSYIKEGEFDLVLCGHEHGGQWRLPGLIDGIYSPDEGLFPRYAGGEYDFPEKRAKMIVSRGLALDNTFIPRLFNRPEIVVIDVG